MEPMKPMQPMKPMEPMKPMRAQELWWPKDLGSPSTSGSQNQMRYAFFPQEYLLLIEIQGKITAHDSGNHQIAGVAQQQGEAHTLTFSCRDGNVALKDLKQIEIPD